MFSARPSNFPTVYMLDAPTSYCPFLASQTVSFPPPRSGPVALKSMSAVHPGCCRDLSHHTAPLWFPGAGGVSMILFDRMVGCVGSPNKRKFGIELRSGDILGTQPISCQVQKEDKCSSNSLNHLASYPKLNSVAKYADCAQTLATKARGSNTILKECITAALRYNSFPRSNRIKQSPQNRHC
jgi:hypothetical protein